MGFYNDWVFTEAIAQTIAILETDSSDEMATRIEQIAGNADLAMATLLLMTMKAKGVDITKINGIELANMKPTIADLIIPGRGL